MKNNLIFFLAPFLIIAYSCQKTIEPKELPSQDARMVLNSILYPDTFIKASISKSKSIISGKSYKYVSGATCRVLENDIFLGELTYVNDSLLSSKLVPKPGKKYSFFVSAPGFTTVSASTDLPAKVSVSAPVRYDTTTNTFRENTYGPNYKNFGGTIKCRFTIIDNPNVKNYYSITPYVIMIDTSGEKIKQVSTYAYDNLNSNSGNFFGSIEINDLDKVNGNEIQLDISVGASADLQNNKVKSIEVYLMISSLSEDYYRYKVTLDKQYSTGISLFAEPVLVYSNVSNGMGILAGASNQLIKLY